MRKKPIFVLLALFVLLVMVQSVFAMESETHKLTWFVPMSGSGGAQMSSTNYRAYVTVGQVAVRFATSPGYDLQMGFWATYGMPKSERIYLPVLRK